MSKEESIQQLQMMEQSLQNFLSQKQQYQQELVEVEHAEKHVTTSEEAYQIHGNVMIKSEKEALLEELKEKREQITVRLETIEKQEAKVRDRVTELQKAVMEHE